MPITPESPKFEPAQALIEAAKKWFDSVICDESDLNLELAVVNYGISEPIEDMHACSHRVGTDVHVVFESGMMLSIPVTD